MKIELYEGCVLPFPNLGKGCDINGTTRVYEDSIGGYHIMIRDPTTPSQIEISPGHFQYNGQCYWCHLRKLTEGVFRIEKMIDTRTRKNQKEALVTDLDHIIIAQCAKA